MLFLFPFSKEQISSPYHVITSSIGVFLFNVEEPVLFPHKTTGKLIVLFE